MKFEYLLNNLINSTKNLMKKQGLYDPLFEHENCGAGFICSLKGVKTNKIIN